MGAFVKMYITLRGRDFCLYFGSSWMGLPVILKLLTGIFISIVYTKPNWPTDQTNNTNLHFISSLSGQTMKWTKQNVRFVCIPVTNWRESKKQKLFHPSKKMGTRQRYCNRIKYGSIVCIIVVYECKRQYNTIWYMTFFWKDCRRICTETNRKRILSHVWNHQIVVYVSKSRSN